MQLCHRAPLTVNHTVHAESTAAICSLASVHFYFEAFAYSYISTVELL